MEDKIMLRKRLRRKPYAYRFMHALQLLLDVDNFEAALEKTSKKHWSIVEEIQGKDGKPEYIMTVTVTTKKIEGPSP
jgi:(p)ppGpp synthase/HD superfamily hydrolase